MLSLYILRQPVVYGRDLETERGPGRPGDRVRHLWRGRDTAGARTLTAAGDAAPGRRLSILHIVAPAAVGGLESVVRALAAGHVAAGHRVRVAAVMDRAPGGPHPFLDGLAAAGVETEAVVVPGRGYVAERRAIARICAAFAPDVVHTHGYRPDVIDASVARGRGTATVTTVHGFTGGGWRNRLYERVQLLAFRRFSAVVAVSRPLLGRLAAAGVSPARTHLIPNAVVPSADSSVSRADARVALGLGTDRFTVGWVGRLSREKGPDVLLAALAGVDGPVSAVVVGDGRERAALRAQAMALGLDATVTWAGAVPDAARWMRAFDVVVLSSRTEGTPIVLLEAMAAGVPVIATAVGGVPDVVTSAEAILVPPDAPAALAGAIARVRDQPAEARDRAAAARVRLETVFSPAVWLSAYASLYAAVANEASVRAAGRP